MLTIGSLALKEHFSWYRVPRDSDVILTWDEFESRFNGFRKYPTAVNKWIVTTGRHQIWECEIAWSGSTGAELLRRAGDREIATPAECLALKLSHRYLKNSPHFTKTMKDIHALRDAGVELDEWLIGWLKRREDETYDYVHPRLDRSKDDFFSDDGVGYVYDHDTLHKAVALNDRPAYTYFQVSDADVLCDMKKFGTLPKDIRIGAVWEESAVLALERSIVPFNGDPSRAFITALKKVCTSITSGKFREFAWENYDNVLELNEKHNYISMFNKGLHDGVVQRVDE